MAATETVVLFDINNIHINVPNTNTYIYVGDVCKIPAIGDGNFTAAYGDYTPSNERNSMPVYGWFFIGPDGKTYSIKKEYFNGIQVTGHSSSSGGATEYEPGASYSRGDIVWNTIGVLYQAATDFTACSTGDTYDDFMTDVDSGNLVPVDYKDTSEPIIPIMTSATDPSGTASCGGYYGTDATVQYAFDRNDSTSLVYSSENKTGGWVAYEFDAAQDVRYIVAKFGNYRADNSISATLYVYDANGNETEIGSQDVTGYAQPAFSSYRYDVHMPIKKFKFVFGYKTSNTNIFTYDIQAYK